MKYHVELGKKMYTELELTDIVKVYASKYFIEYGRNPSGYGRKIATRYIIKCVDGRLHRVYCVCFSNAGSLYIVYKGNPCVMCETAINDYELKTGINIREAAYI